MIDVVLYQPEIAPNTGNIIRLCANANLQLHLIKPYGFVLDDKRLRRAGLDYHEWARVREYDDFESFMVQHAQRRIWYCTTKGKQHYHEVAFSAEDMLCFGPESRGLPEPVLRQAPSQLIRIPMAAHSRSLNLSNTVAIIAFEALRQQGFAGLD